MERIHMQLEVLKAETLSKLNKLFREKVQYDEMVKENEIQIHFGRGLMEGYAQAQKICKEIYKAQQIEASDKMSFDASEAKAVVPDETVSQTKERLVKQVVDKTFDHSIGRGEGVVER